MKQKHYYPISQPHGKEELIAWFQGVRQHFDKLNIKAYMVKNRNKDPKRRYEVWRESHPKDYTEIVMKVGVNGAPAPKMTKHDYYQYKTTTSVKPSCVTDLSEVGCEWEEL